MKYALFFTLVMLCCPPVFGGDVYQWMDGQGGIHFTDNMDNVPAQYRKKVKIIEPVAPVDGKGGASHDQSAPSARKASSGERYGGDNEESWRARFKKVRADLKAAQDELVAKNDELTAVRRERTLYHRSRDRVFYNDLKDKITQNEQQIKDLQTKLEELEKAADQADVPMGWRQ